LDLGVNFPYYCDKGGVDNGCYSGSSSFKGEIKASISATPFVSVQAGYYFEASGDVKVLCNATINYAPEDVSFNFKLSTKDVTITPKFVIKENQKSKSEIFSFETEGWTRYKRGVIYEYNNKE